MNIDINNQKIYIPTEALKITKIIYTFCLESNIYNNKLTVLDYSSNIGLISIPLSSVFNTVICIETDPKKFNLLVNNTSSYQCSNIKCFSGDSDKLLFHFKPDIIYFDTIIENITYLFDLFKTNTSLLFVCIKINLDYGLQTLYKLADSSGYSVYLYHLVKYNIVIIY